MKVKVGWGQTLEDIALHQYGSIQGIDMLLEDNSLSMDDSLQPGQELVIRDGITVDDTAPLIKQYYNENGLIPNTGIAPIVPEVAYVNTGYWEDGYTDND